MNGECAGGSGGDGGGGWLHSMMRLAPARAERESYWIGKGGGIVGCGCVGGVRVVDRSVRDNKKQDS